MKRWYVGEMDWYSWVLASMLIVLFLLQLLVMPSSARAVAASVWVERKPAGDLNRNWLACAPDATGQRLLAGDNGGRLWISADCAANWVEAGALAGGMSRYWQVCASDADWISPQTVTVVAVDDAIAEGTCTGRIAHMVASTDTNYNVIVVGAVTTTVEDNEFTLSVTASPSTGGSVIRKPNQTSYPAGTVVTLKVVPASGTVFVGWSGGGSGTSMTMTVTMDADKAVTATFDRDTTRVLTLTIGKYWMYLDGVGVKLDVAPVIQNSRTILPLRAIAEATGSIVLWDAKTRKVTVKRKDRTVELWIGKNTARANGKSMNIDLDDYRVAPIIVNSRTLLPLRFVAESLGLGVQWSDAARTATITWKP